MLDRQQLIKKLRYRSSNRGCKETDLFIGEFAKKNLDVLSEQELIDFVYLLEQEEVDIYGYITRQKPIPTTLKNSMMDKIMSFNINEIAE